MARLKFDLTPEEPWWHRDAETRAEHEAYVRRFYAQHYPALQPRPCDCGFYSAVDALVTCEGAWRLGCHRDVRTRLESRARHQHEKGLAAKRQFPSLGPTPSKHCAWCKTAIVHGRVGQRSMHDGREDEANCRREYEIRTRLEVQRSFLLDRDGRGCSACGAMVGAWDRVWSENFPKQRWAQGHRYFRTCFPECPEGPVTVIQWHTGLEVDHSIALAFAWEAFGADPRWAWFFGPSNLRLLCGGCHKSKTREDIALIRMAQARGPEWAMAEALQRLSDAGLLRIARPEGPSCNAKRAAATSLLPTP